MRGRKGLSITELMVTVAILGVLSGAIFTALNQGNRTFGSGDVQILLQQEARQGLDAFLKDVRESASSTISSVYQYTDPLDGKRHEAIAFATARADPSDAADSSEEACQGAANNSCFHTASGNPSWRGLLVYAFYQTGSGQKQLRRYADYKGVTYTDPVFPFTFQSISAAQITVQSAKGTNIVLTRGPDAPSGGNPRVVVAESVEHEDQDSDNVLDANENDGTQSLPADDADGQLDYGARFAVNGQIASLSLFLRKAQTNAFNTNRFIVVNLDGSDELRN